MRPLLLFTWSPDNWSQSLFWPVVIYPWCCYQLFVSIMLLSISAPRLPGHHRLLTHRQSSDSLLGTHCIWPSGLCWSDWHNLCSIHPYIWCSWSIKILMFPSKGHAIWCFLLFTSFIFLKGIFFYLFPLLTPQVIQIMGPLSCSPLLPNLVPQITELVTSFSFPPPLHRSLWLLPPSVLLCILSLSGGVSCLRAGSLAHLSLCLQHLAECLTCCYHLLNVD